MNDQTIKIFDHRQYLMSLFIYWFLGGIVTIPVVFFMLCFTISGMFLERWWMPENFEEDS